MSARKSLDMEKKYNHKEVEQKIYKEWVEQRRLICSFEKGMYLTEVEEILGDELKVIEDPCIKYFDMGSTMCEGRGYPLPPSYKVNSNISNNRTQVNSSETSAGEYL